MILDLMIYTAGGFMKELNFITIGANIKKRRLALGVTQEYIANILDVNPSHISNIECGRANPSLTALVNIANILNCSVDVFIRDEYTIAIDPIHKDNFEEKILTKLQYMDNDKKENVLKILDLL